MLELAIEKRLEGFHLKVAFSVGNEMVALFGPSGSGKSLTLQCIAGLVTPDAGRVTINGRTVFDSTRKLNLSPQERHIGYVFQNYALLPHMTVEQNIAYGLHRLPKEERSQKVREIITRMRLEGLERRRPAQLSGGQQQRVALARALVTGPEALLLDEPFSALDSAIRSRLQAELLQLLRGLSITAILVTHNLAEAYTLSEKMVVYDGGRVIQVGHRDQVLHRPQTRAVARFTGAKNIFEGVVKASAPDFLAIETGGVPIVAPPYPYAPGERIEFCIRPEHVMLVRPGLGTGTAIRENQLTGEIVGEIAHGSTYTLLFRLDSPLRLDQRDYDLHIELPSHVYHKLGLTHRHRWTVSLKKSAIHVIGPTLRRP